MGRLLREGEFVHESGVSFTLDTSLPRLVDHTRSSSGFTWRWLPTGGIVSTVGGELRQGDGLVLMGDDGVNVHAIGLPLSDDRFPYVIVPMDALSIETRSGVFTKLKHVVVQVGGELGFDAFAVDELSSPRWHARSQRSRAFVDHYQEPRSCKIATGPDDGTVEQVEYPQYV